MGITWKVAMTLLSTLAALVIIVHSEENLDPDYRYELKPRAVNTGTLLHDEPWRSLEAEPKQTANLEPRDMDTSEEPPRRRKRLRKRRPVTLADTDSTESYKNYNEDPLDVGKRQKSSDKRSVQDKITIADVVLEESQQYKEEPYNTANQQERDVRRTRHKNKPKRRRRKKPEKTRLFDDNIEGTSRIIVHSRKNSKHRFSEFGDYFIDSREWPQEPTKNREDLVNIDDDYNGRNENEDEKAYIEYDTQAERDITTKSSTKKTKHSRKYLKWDDSENRPIETNDDKSLSEFSLETLKMDDSNINDVKINSNADDIALKANNDAPIDAFTLKEILKKSNGSSLSEILQQNNLTLADLLRGGETAISILKSSENPDNQHTEIFQGKGINLRSNQNKMIIAANNDDKHLQPDIDFSTAISEIRNTNVDMPTANNDTESKVQTDKVNIEPKKKDNLNSSNTDIKSSYTNENKRQFNTTTRKRLRMKPINSFKAQISRDFVASNRRRPAHGYFNYNATKARQWRTAMSPLKKSLALNNNGSSVVQETEKLETILEPMETTTETELNTVMDSVKYDEFNNSTIDTNAEDIVTEGLPKAQTTITTTDCISTTDMEITDKPRIITTAKTRYRPSLRRFTLNTQKNKRTDQRNSTESTGNTIADDFISPLNNVPVQKPIETATQKITTVKDDDTTLEDFITTTFKSSDNEIFLSDIQSETIPHEITTEDTVKLEIKEILYDTQTSTKLKKILSERNMSLNELFEHRERGSSHVHLADIFHNASKEPNPPEPFLSKSFIEPISRETYPLRALLEANLHDPATKAIIEPLTANNIPLVMNYGNNINENRENLGIMSLFEKIAERKFDENENEYDINEASDYNKVKNDTKDTPHITNTKNVPTEVNMTENRRQMHDSKEIVGWNDIFSLINPKPSNFTGTAEAFTQELPVIDRSKEIIVEKDAGEDGLIVIEDLHQKDFYNDIESQSNEKLDVEKKYYGQQQNEGILQATPNNSTSVTVVTVSILGLALVLFLLTYVGFKWKNQTRMHRKNSFRERIPTPVFENRKGQKNNSSMRSLSPILSSNIYTISTMDSQNGKESEYGFSTRKPFQ